MKRVLVICLFLLTPCVAIAQPTGSWLVVNPGYPTNHGYIQLPSSASLNFAGGSFTFEAWVAIKDDTSACVSIAGNGYQSSTWIGVCGTTLRSYVRGSGSSYTVGTVRAHDWTHIAVTFDAATNVHRHYIDGELVGERTEPGPITSSPNAWRIFSDANYFYTPTGAIDEVRFWNTARTIEQIRSTITSSLTTPQSGLVAVYPLDGNANDVIGGLNGTRTGPGGYLNGAIGTGCTTTSSVLCVGPSGRFSVSATYLAGSTFGNATVTSPSTSESGIFWFFAPTNWEVIVKVLNGCGVNNKWWVFTSALTNQHYEIEVTDIQRGITKRYFNYQGVIAPQIQDVDAFATCP